MDNSKEFKKYAMGSRNIGSLKLHNYEKHMQRFSGNTTLTNMTPHIVEERKMNAVIMSVFDRLMQDRILILGTPIDSDIASIICAQLLFLESADPKRDIFMYITSGGGDVAGGNSIIDVMEYITAPVSTINMGTAASMAAVILACGDKGKRGALKRSRTMIHQVSGGMGGDFTEMSIQLKEAEIARNSLYVLLAEKTGKTFDQIERDCDRDNFLSAEEAVSYGLVDFVVSGKK